MNFLKPPLPLGILSLKRGAAHLRDKIPQVPWSRRDPRGLGQAQGGGHCCVCSIQNIPARTTGAWGLLRPESWLETGNCGARPGSWPAAWLRARRITLPERRRPYLNWAGLLLQRKDALDGSTERRLLVWLPLDHRELQVISWRWGPGPLHGRGEED